MLEQKETQQFEGQASTRSLTQYRVPFQGAIHPERMQPDAVEIRWMTQALLQAERALPIFTKYICLFLAVLNYFHPHETFTTFLLMGIATGTLSIREVLDALLQYAELLHSLRISQGKQPRLLGKKEDESSEERSTLEIEHE